MSRRRSFGAQRGNAIIEFAFVLPLLVVLFGAMVDFGFVFQRYLVITNAAREGARVAVLPGYTDADVTARAVNYYQAGTGTTATPTVTVTTITIDPPGPTPGFPAREVVMSAQHNYLILGPLMGLFGASPFGTVTLTARTAMRVEGGV